MSTDKSSADKPVMVVDAHGDNRWMCMHERFVMEAKEKEPEVVLLGDSLFANLMLTEVWEKMFEPMHCLNFSIGGDETQNLLWRCMNGELENMSPQVIVLSIGTNNHQHSAEEVFNGIMAIVRSVQQKQPQAQLLVVSIPPRGKFHNPLRQKIGEINCLLSEKLPSVENTSFLNLDPGLFLNPNDGSISHRDMFDYLHLTSSGYQKFCEPILDEIQTLLKDFVKSGSHEAV